MLCISAFVYLSSNAACAASGSWTSIFTALAGHEWYQPSLPVIATLKPSFSSSLPSIFSPEGSATVAVVGVPDGYRKRTSRSGGLYFLAMPARSPVGERHPEHPPAPLKYDLPPSKAP